MRAYRVAGKDRHGRPIKEREPITAVSDLEKIGFEKALVIDKLAWDQMKKRAGTQGDHLDLTNFLAKTETRREDLFLDATDVARLKGAMQEQIELVNCPFAGPEQMPGIYWMFQAASYFNIERTTKVKDSIQIERPTKMKDSIQAWLKGHVKDRFNSPTLGTAAKFVRMEVRRSQGGPSRKKVNLDAIGELKGKKEDYAFDFVGEHFSMILAITDWWVAEKHRDSNAKKIELAKTFIKNTFAGHEVGDLVYLISEERITPEENGALRKWAKANGMTPRDVVYIDRRRRAPV